jgi:DNA-binding PadR family transcriptional regulator
MSTPPLYRGSLSTVILKLLGDEGEMYGYQITQKVKEMTQGSLELKEGALYPSLHKLQAEGYLSVRVEKQGKRLRKYYRITESGLTEQHHRLEQLDEFLSNMQRLLNPKWSVE